jgi:hypothetical protein
MLYFMSLLKKDLLPAVQKCPDARPPNVSPAHRGSFPVRKRSFV